ncbi:SNF2 family N-terminal domain-containing protein [Lactarius akahatsu]|uniref:SNF2 family N-terminal domain-containing protein n=1 Tax=Lactarius akahatsu TaxID=416441 RepID=A0AAD4LFY3_9AGAM|nr:SNF2 family N-terminal domain-containing protein [Lactarius akahatsu]
MAGIRRKVATEQNEASTVSTTPSSVPFPNSNAGSTTDTPATSGVEDEEFHLHKKVNERSKRTLSIRQKRSADQSLSFSPQPSAKRRAVTKGIYVEIPVRPGNVSNKGKGKGPSIPAGEEDDEIVPDSEASLGYDELATLDSDGSDFEDSELNSDDDDGDDSDEGISLRGGRKLPHKKASRVKVVDDPEEEEEIMLNAAIAASMRYSTNGGASTSTTRASRTVSTRATRAAAAAERRLALEQGVQIDSDVILDSDLEGELLIPTDSEDEPIAKKPKPRSGNLKVKKKGKEKTENDRDSPDLDYFSVQREARKRSRLEKQQIRMLEHQLNRRLTYAERSTVQLHRHHPELCDAWGDLEAALGIVEPQKAEQPSTLKVTLLPFQQESLFWMRKQEFGQYAGGLLADEMGMGKTIQMIALMVSGSAKPNLVVAPTVAIMQWRNEIGTHTTGMDVLVWHGASRMTDPEELKKYDVVLTTYAVLESCFRKQQSGFKRKGAIIKEKSPLHVVEWERVILDEAHNIKERATNTAKATFELNAKYRWCLSGTPLQNRVGELYSLIRFLGCDPFSHYYCKKCACKSLHWKFSDKRTCDDCGHSPMMHTCFWNNEILTPIQKHGMLGPGAIAFKKLRVLLDRIMLRRTKIQRADDLGLPPRTVIVRRDYFSPEEKELYLSLFSDAKRQFSTYLDAGTLLNNYSNVFSLITRMRQMACHPDLVIRSKNNAGVFGEEDGEATVCRLCNDVAEDAIQAKCRHIFDRECIKQYLNAAIEAHPACPVCHLALTIDLEAPALELEMPTTARQGILGRLDVNAWRSSSKIEALVEELSNLRNQDATTKSIVFSQFVNFLDLIAFRLQRAGFSICRLEGTMSPQARDATIQHFMNNVHVTVFLVSLKAGGVALNLTEASRVYLMDSWWNPAVEFQAMDRIHRLGQRRPVQAIKLVVEDSIESRIVQLQEKKSAMVDATLSTDDSAMGRLTPEDVCPVLSAPFRITDIRALPAFFLIQGIFFFTLSWSSHAHLLQL